MTRKIIRERDYQANRRYPNAVKAYTDGFDDMYLIHEEAMRKLNEQWKAEIQKLLVELNGT